MVLGVSSGTRLGPKGDDAVSTGHGESSDLVGKLATKRAKRRARKIEQKKKKTPRNGFQPAGFSQGRSWRDGCAFCSRMFGGW